MRVLVTGLLTLALSVFGGPIHAVDADREKPTVLHRLVWADGSRANPGIHIRSMERDGTDIRSAYDWPHGFTLELSLDPAGRRVAFSPCCRTSLPLLVVAPVLGGKAREPLKKGPRFDAVGGIGWSPNGRRIAFEGFSGPTGARVTTIWTVRPNGKDLRKVLVIPASDPNQPVFNRYLAWTPDGILYSDGEDLLSAWNGRSTLVMRNANVVRISGDGSRLVVEREKNGKRSVWVSDPDGSHRRKLLVQGRLGEGTLYLGVTPSFDASELLATRVGPGTDDEIVTWRTSENPDSASVLELPDQYTTVVTWN